MSNNDTNINENYSLSKYIKRMDSQGYTALFNGLTLKKAYGRTELIDSALQKIQQPYSSGDKTIDSMIRSGFVVKSGEDSARFDMIRNTVGEINISNIVMIVANDCNLRCAYCQIEENMEEEQKKGTDKRPYNMSLEVAKKALDLYEANSQKADKRTISITGGEPLMNMSTVKYVLSRTKKMDNARTIIFTNGVMVNEKLADYFSQSGALMLVSLDGPKDIHDSVRHMKNGGGSYEKSVKGYHLLKDAGCKVGISAVTGTHNKDNMGRVRDLFIDLKPPSIGLNYGHHLLDEGKPNPSTISMVEFTKILTNFYSEMREKNIFVENISRFITPFYLEQPRVNECQAQGRGFSVDSRGLMGVCKSLLVSDRISFPLDSVGKISEIPVFQEWANRSPFTLEECVDDCQVIGLCGGGCIYDSFAVNNGDIQKIDPRICEYTESMAEFLVWDLFNGIGIVDKLEDGIYIPSSDEQEAFFLRKFDSANQLQRSVGHEKDQ